jgi:uncharacterized membrane protein (UPF0127 family)
VNRLFIVSILAIAIIVLALGALVYVTQWNGHEADLPGKDNTETPHVPVVDMVCDNGTVMRMDIEIAETPDEQKTGLMNRTSLAEYAGMLFVFDDDDRRYFWMENTLIPLDMIFIASNLTIIDIHENATPMSQDIIASSGACRYVLEVNGGLCAANGIDIGDRVTLDLN